MEAKKVKAMLTKEKKVRVLTDRDFVSTGSTLLNLACTGRVNRGFAKGHVYLLVGGTQSGKTFLSMSCFAEAAINRDFDDFDFIYDNGEEGMHMDIERLFGKKANARIRPPAESRDGSPIYSYYLEDFYYHLDDACKRDRPFIYVLDSIDSLTSTPEVDKFEETKTARRKGKEVTGSYGDGKAKINSAFLRRFIRPIKRLGSIVIIVNQARANFGGYGGDTHSGGRSLDHYANMILWCYHTGDVTKTFRGKLRFQGTVHKIKTEKTRMTGKEHKVDVSIFADYGIDDIGSCIDYLVSEGHWEKKRDDSKDKKDAEPGKQKEGNVIFATEFRYKATRDKLADYISNNKLEKDLSNIVGDVWEEIEEAVSIKRRPRYE